MKKSAIAIALLAVLCSAQGAGAAYDPLGTGTTKLVLDKGFVSLLEKHKVSISTKAPAKLKGGALTLPVFGGEMDPLNGKGTIDHEGVLIFRSSKGKVPFRALTLKAKKTPLSAKVGGSQLKIAKAKTIKSMREGFGEGFRAKGLVLTQKVATRLNKKLGLGRLLSAGQPFGESISKTQPLTTVILPQGRATFTPDPAFKAKLDSLFVSVNPIFPAEGGGGAFSFPITVEGEIAPNASTGTLKVSGDLEFLQLGAGQVFWHEPWIDLAAKVGTTEVDVEPAPTFPGKLGRIGTFDVNIAAAAISSDPNARTITVSGAPLALQAQNAQTFNQAFAKGGSTFAAGEAIGSLSFMAQGQ